MRPFFSVVVPVYNVESYLERCVTSLLNQTHGNLEIILVDDGSKDGSGNICDRYSSEHDNILSVHKLNGGLASARNEGLKYVNGKYISFIDSDDWIEPDMFEKIYKKIKDTNCDMLTFGYQKINEGMIVVKEHAQFPEGSYDLESIKNVILPNSIAQQKAFNQVNLPVQLSACMNVYRHDFLKKNDLIFESERIVLSEDWLFNIKCLCRAQKMIIIHDIFYNYDTREDSLSMSYKPDAYERKKNLFWRYCEEINITNQSSNEIKQRLVNFWLEGIYNCVVIELHSGKWDRKNKNRILKICNDSQYLSFIKKLKFRDCTLKGWIFIYLMKFKMLSFFRKLYFLKQSKKVES